MSDILRFPDVVSISLRTEIEAAIAAVASVHRLSDLPQINVYIAAEDRFGGYTPASEERPRSIGVSGFGLTPRLTTVHEFGHFVDDAIGGFETYFSQEPASLLSQVIAVAEGTQTIQAMRKYEQRTQGAFSLERAQVMNRLEEVEVWARAYAQYIAYLSGDTRLLAEVQTRRDVEIGVLKNEQWEQEDFTPVSLAIDALMRRLGWQL